MAYIDENTRWRFTVPQAGEVDSAESVEQRMVEIDEALIGPMNKAELLSNGKKLSPSSFVDGDTSYYSDVPDSYWSTIEGRPIYTTKSHYHPIPSVVLHSNQANSASYAEAAERATSASQLSPGVTLNGHLVTGGMEGQDVDILINDIPDATRVFWGSSLPTSAPLPELRPGDIYVQVM